MSRSLAAAAIALALYGAMAQAEESFTERFSVRGFSTAGITYSSEEEADFTGRYAQPTGAGRTDKWGSGVDSRVGFQLDAKISSRLSAVVQTIVERQFDNEFRPGLEWANLKYQIAQDWSVRVGRVVAPTLMHSESSKVGYSYLWVRPQIDMYRVVPFTNLDGIETSYRTRFGKVIATLQAEYGKTDVSLTTNVGAVDLTYDPLLLLNATFEWDEFLLRFGYAHADSDIKNETVSQVWALLGSVGLGDLADQLGRADSQSATYNLGGAYEGETWTVASELSYLKVHNTPIADFAFGYVSVGRHFGSLTPYLVLADAKRVHTPRFSTSVPQFAPLYAIANSFVTGNFYEQRSVSVGARWDVRPALALKIQATHTMPDDDSVSTLINRSPSFRPGRDYQVVSVTVDFTF